jgi:Leucine-rich repeat (LRR) protein
MLTPPACPSFGAYAIVQERLNFLVAMTKSNTNSELQHSYSGSTEHTLPLMPNWLGSDALLSQVGIQIPYLLSRLTTDLAVK